MCARWRESFENFLADMGKRPSSKFSIDRIDTNGNYEPGNCRWATSAEQNNNRRDNLNVTWNGKTQSITKWERELGFGLGSLWSRLKSGWSVEKTLATPKLVTKSK